MWIKLFEIISLFCLHSTTNNNTASLNQKKFILGGPDENHPAHYITLNKHNVYNLHDKSLRTNQGSSFLHTYKSFARSTRPGEPQRFN